MCKTSDGKQSIIDVSETERLLQIETQLASKEAEVIELKEKLAALEIELECRISERISELAKANQRLELASRKRFQESQSMIRHFACMSHEIRTPLNCIVGMTSLLHDTPLNQFQQEAVRMITTSGDLLSTVVDDVLDFSKLQAGNFSFDIKEVDLQTALNSVTSNIQMRADQAKTGLWIRSYIGTSVPQYYETDGKRLQQILYNLLGNAVKFSKKNAYVDLKVNIVTSEKSKRIQFQVKDYGKGIAKENLGKIFEPFHQESKETGTLYGGTGLGLPVALQLARNMGGDIWVDSVEGKWSEFTLQLPFIGQEITDFSAQVARMEKSAVLVVVARPTTDCPVIKWLRGHGINVELIPSCNELEITALAIATTYATEYYIALIHDEALDEATFAKFQAKYKTQLITFGYNHVSIAAAHINSPCRVFPSLLLPIMGDLIERLKSKKNGIISTNLDSSIIIINGQEPSQKKCQKSPVIVVKSDFPMEKLRILIAEDNIVNQKVLTKTLNRLGIENIDVVDNGEKAVKSASQKQYDLIFMDMEMPIMNGIEACKHITKAKLRLFPIIVFVTAHAMEDFRIKAKAVGGYSFISKPFHLGMIEGLLRSIPWERLTETELRSIAAGKQVTPILWN